MSIPKEPYLFDPAFERAVVTLCASKSRFWARIGYALDPDCMGLPASRLVLQACALIHREVGHGPTASMLVIQRLRRLMAEGKVALAQIHEAADVFDQAEDFGLPNEDDVAKELTPLIRRRMQSEAVMLSHDQYAKRGDFKIVVDLVNKASRVGEQDNSIGTIAGPAGFTEIDNMNSLVRLPTGVLDLDLQMVDGLHRGGLGVHLGGAADGKSMMLLHQTASGARDMKLFAGLATLELPKAVQLARLFANLTGVPTNQILSNPLDRAEAKRRMELMAPYIGAVVVEEFAPHATTVLDISDWADRCADQFGRPFDLLVVDYADKLHHQVRSDNEYERMKFVYEGLRRDLAVAKNMWCWTASQAARATKDQGKRLELHHVADSMHKVRVADVVITLNARDDGSQMLFFVAKNRLGRGRFQVGPVPTDFERARMVPASREFFDWTQV